MDFDGSCPSTNSAKGPKTESSQAIPPQLPREVEGEVEAQVLRNTEGGEGVVNFCPAWNWSHCSAGAGAPTMSL